MQKEILRKLRALPATKEMMQKGKRLKEKEKIVWKNGRYQDIKEIVPEYDALIRVQNLQGYIKIAVFFPEYMKKDIITPKYEIFLNVAGEEYLTRELDEEGKEKRWLTSMILNLEELKNFGYYNKPHVFMSKDAIDTLKRLKPSSQRAGIYNIQEWQQEQKNKQTKRREEKEQAPWDADMKLVPEITSGFKEWMRKDAADEYFIFYEYDPKGAKQGYCSRCKKFVPIKNPKHNKESICPACKAKGKFKSSGKIKTLCTEDYYGEIIQKIEGGIVVRRFTQRQWYREDYKNPSIVTYETERTLIFENGIVKRYEYGLYKNKYHRWILDKDYYPHKRTYYWQKRCKFYKRNYGKLKKISLLKQSAIDLWEVLPTSVANYLEIEKGNPAVEMLAKIGMFKLAEGLIDEIYDSTLLNESETEISKILKIDKARLKRLKEMDGNVCMLRWMQLEKQRNTIWPDKMIEDFGKEDFDTDCFHFLKIPSTFVKCHNYLLKQAEIMGESLEQTRITWRDYTDMAEQMKMDVSLEQIAKPKDLKKAHDRLVLMIKTKGIEKQAKDIEKKWPKVNENLPKLQKFEYTLGEYTIIAPKTVLDIVREGVVLNHCVHTCDYYFSRIQTDESYLFFLRKTKDKDMPWYTLEVEPSGNIRQKRTTGDNQNKDFEAAVNFLKKWQKHFKKQLTEEEKRLGTISEKLRKENYKELRKKGNRVWHGKLQGQLLADVLEADFMEAI